MSRNQKQAQEISETDEDQPNVTLEEIGGEGEGKTLDEFMAELGINQVPQLTDEEDAARLGVPVEDIANISVRQARIRELAGTVSNEIPISITLTARQWNTVVGVMRSGDPGNVLSEEGQKQYARAGIAYSKQVLAAYEAAAKGGSALN